MSLDLIVDQEVGAYWSVSAFGPVTASKSTRAHTHTPDPGYQPHAQAALNHQSRLKIPWHNPTAHVNVNNSLPQGARCTFYCAVMNKCVCCGLICASSMPVRKFLCL